MHLDSLYFPMPASVNPYLSSSAFDDTPARNRPPNYPPRRWHLSQVKQDTSIDPTATGKTLPTAHQQSSLLGDCFPQRTESDSDLSDLESDLNLLSARGFGQAGASPSLSMTGSDGSASPMSLVIPSCMGGGRGDGDAVERQGGGSSGRTDSAAMGANHPVWGEGQHYYDDGGFAGGFSSQGDLGDWFGDEQGTAMYGGGLYGGAKLEHPAPPVSGSSSHHNHHNHHQHVSPAAPRMDHHHHVGHLVGGYPDTGRYARPYAHHLGGSGNSSSTSSNSGGQHYIPHSAAQYRHGGQRQHPTFLPHHQHHHHHHVHHPPTPSSSDSSTFSSAVSSASSHLSSYIPHPAPIRTHHHAYQPTHLTEPYSIPTDSYTSGSGTTSTPSTTSLLPPPSSTTTTTPSPTSPTSPTHPSTSPRERRFQCQTCQKRFLRRQDLNRHSATHLNGYKPFRCEHCGTGFTRQDALHRHGKAKRCLLKRERGE